MVRRGHPDLDEPVGQRRAPLRALRRFQLELATDLAIANAERTLKGLLEPLGLFKRGELLHQFLSMGTGPTRTASVLSEALIRMWFKSAAAPP